MSVTLSLWGNESCISVEWISLLISLYLHTKVHYEPVLTLH